MTDKQPSERALAAAREIFEHIHCDTEAWMIAETALIIDEHCPVQPGYDELVEALKNLVTFFDVRPDSTLPEDVKVHCRELIRRDPHYQQAIAALAAAKENPNGD